MATDTDKAFDKQLDPGVGLTSETYRKEHALQKSSDDLTPFDIAATPGEAGVWAVEGVILVRAGGKEAAEAEARRTFVGKAKVRQATQADLAAELKLRDDEAAEAAKEQAAAQKAAEAEAKAADKE